MKLTTVAFSTSDMAEQVIFGVQDLDPDTRYRVRTIAGIDAEEVIPKFIGRGLVSGKRFYDFTMKPRDIVFRVSLNPKYAVNEDVEEIRNAIYRLISANMSGELLILFKSDPMVLYCLRGLITKMEVAHFSRTPELQITIHCEDPIFKSSNPMVATPEELTATNPIEVTDDLSTAPHGFNFRVEFTAVTSTFIIQDDPTDPDWTFEVTPATSFQIGDELYISSEYGAKRVFWDKSAGTDVELMDKVVIGSLWPKIFPGLNTLYFMQIANFDWIDFRFHAHYWGI